MIGVVALMLIGSTIAVKDPCLEPPVSGPCRGLFERYHYDSKTHQCQKFYYGGCGGNDNNFPSLDDCNEKCDPCTQEPDLGWCKGAIIRYYYDFELGKCVPFAYGGCEGNINNFAGREECQSKCEVDAAGSEATTMPADLGCQYGGVSYKPGDAFTVGCNTCVCSKNNVVSCTKMACLTTSASPKDEDEQAMTTLDTDK